MLMVCRSVPFPLFNGCIDEPDRVVWTQVRVHLAVLQGWNRELEQQPGHVISEVFIQGIRC